jgi:hypothetical protein
VDDLSLLTGCLPEPHLACRAAMVRLVVEWRRRPLSR